MSRTTKRADRPDAPDRPAPHDPRGDRADPGAEARGRPAPRPWGWAVPGGGRAAAVAGGTPFQGTTTQVCGLYPFAVSSGATPPGVPVGRHLFTA
jgi:hypothetical protein